MKSSRNKIPSSFFLGSFFALLFLAIPILFAFPKSYAAEAESREYVLKAGFIYNFTKFIDWPRKTKADIKAEGYRFCVVGRDPFGEILDRLAEKLKRKNKALIIQPQVSLEEVSRCHILFIGKSEKSRVDQILAWVDGLPVLVVGDTPGYAQKGVGINFFILGNKIRFEINRNAVEKAGLQVSSELLNLAKIVSGREDR